ncbi:AAA family ATPase [Rickettsia hoogstraalii]|uniref:ParA family partition ATPase n=1 Tax=Rickettsia hoogstraalii TaxID=467174 RepID=UPI002251D63A|nr:ParA family partition ATPase [Rickettsia hoogstraalii]MCX4084721.1 AAA family ATPase [Rickettsia hoogstraalii]
MDSKIITIANQKGGCGKTTITIQLAGALSKDKLKILVVDADPQATATRWISNASEEGLSLVHVIGLSATGEKVHKEVKKYVKSYDYILIDCPPAVESIIPQSALTISDMVLIPVIPSPADLWAAIGIKSLITRVQGINDELKALIIPNMCQNNVSLTQEVIKIIHDFDIPVSKNNLCLRTAYRQSAALGTTVHDIKGAGKAIQEITHLKNEIITVLTV